MSPRRTALALLLLVAGARCALAAPTFDEIMGNFAFAPGDVERVRRGELVETAIAGTSDRELAVGIAFLVHAPVPQLVHYFEIGAGFHNDPQVEAAIEIRGDGTPNDFTHILLEPGGEREAHRYLTAAPGDVLNLDADEIAAFQKIAGSEHAGRVEVQDGIRTLLLSRYQAYRTRGLAGVTPYARESGKETNPADELRRMTEEATVVKKYAPAFHALLMSYPQDKPPDLRENFFCIRYAMSGRPNFTLRHRMAMPVDQGYVVADREFYATHDFNDMQAIAGLFPTSEGTVVVYIGRSTTDQVGGFAASAKKALARSLMAKELASVFEKGRTEVGRKPGR